MATLDDLYRVDGKAELIAGRIVRFPPTGIRSARIRGRLLRSLDDFAKRAGGHVFGSTIAYGVPELASGRRSFSPDVSYYVWPLPEDEMAFIEGPSRFAVEVRGKDNYGRIAETELAAKRADYVEAGNFVVWDVDTKDEVVRCYRVDAADRLAEFRRGIVADAEPAVPEWRVAVDDLFR